MGEQIIAGFFFAILRVFCVGVAIQAAGTYVAASVQSLKQITAQKNSPPVTQSSATNAGSASESNAQKTQHLVSFSQEEIDKKLT